MLNQPQHHTDSLLPYRPHLIPFASLLKRTQQLAYHPRVLPSSLLRLPCGRDPLQSPDLSNFKCPPGRLGPPCSGFPVDVCVWREGEREMEVGVVPE